MSGKLFFYIISIVIVIGTIFGCAEANDPAITEEPDDLLEVTHFLSTIGQVRHIDVKGDRVYCAEDQAGFTVYDYVNETEVLHYTGLIENARLISFVEESNILFLYDRYGSPAQIRIYDLTDINNVVVKPPIIGNTGGIDDMKCYNNNGTVDFYITRNETDFEFKKINWDGFYATPQYTYSDYSITLNGFDMNDDYIFISYEQLGLNITDRATGDVVSITDTPGDARDVKIVDNYAYVCDRHAGIAIIDVTDPTAPQHVGNVDTSGYTQDIDILDNYLVVASGGGGVYLYDITNHEAPQLIGNVDDSEIGYTYSVKFAQDYIIAGTRDGVAKISYELE